MWADSLIADKKHLENHLTRIQNISYTSTLVLACLHRESQTYFFMASSYSKCYFETQVSFHLACLPGYFPWSFSSALR